MSKRLPGTGWRKDREDHRDFRLFRTTPAVEQTAETSDLWQFRGPDLDQGPIGSCTGWAAGRHLRATRQRYGVRNPAMPSPVELYLLGRQIGGYPERDDGAEIRNVHLGMTKTGVIPMSRLKPRFDPKRDLPDPNTYEFPTTSVWRRPLSKSNLQIASDHQVLVSFRFRSVEEILKSLTDGYSVNIGFYVYPNLYGPSGPRFDVPMPEQGMQPEGGHAVVIGAHNRSSTPLKLHNGRILQPRRFLLWQQWGPGVHEGCSDFTLPFEFFENGLADDWWSVRQVEGDVARALIGAAKAEAELRKAAA
jgi:hypothetical protein